MSLSTTHVFTLTVNIAEPMEVGPTPAGFRRVIPITGGSVSGPELSREILPGGADWNTVTEDGTVHVWARYEFRTDEGAVVGVINEGTHTPSSPLDLSNVDPSSLSVVTKPTFTAPLDAPAWLNKDTFAGILRPVGPAQVEIRVYRLHPTA